MNCLLADWIVQPIFQVYEGNVGIILPKRDDRLTGQPLGEKLLDLSQRGVGSGG